MEAAGQDAHGAPASAEWTLDATANLGPYVPVVPALALIRRVRGGSRLDPGAYPCSGILALAELEAILDELGIDHTAASLPPALAA